MSTASDKQAFHQIPPPTAPGGQLHPATILLAPLQQVRALIALVITGAFAPAVAAGAVAVAALASVVRWARFWWQVTEGTLVIRQGLLERRQRVIPLERIQTVDLVRPLGHRLLGVVQMRIETVGGSETEGRLDALAPEVAERLRAVLLGQASEAAALSPDDRDVLARVGPGTLALAGLTGGRVGVVAVLVGAADEFLGDRFEQLFGLPARLGVRGTVILVIVAAVAAFAISVAATAVAYWGFTLTRGDEVLLVRRGLLEQRLDTLPIHRIQALTIEENVARRLLGRAAVRVEIAGRPGAEARQTGVLLPLGQRAEALALVERVLGVEGLAALRLEPMPARARTRRVVRAVAVSALATLGASVWVGTIGLLALGLLVPLVAWALAAYRALGHAEHHLDPRPPSGAPRPPHPSVVVARAGVLVRRTSFVPVTRLQSLELSASPFQRRTRLATLALQIASSGASSDPRMRDLDRGVGEDLLQRLAHAIPAG